jgi:hypothetical protein
MPWNLYETDDKGNPIDRRICTGWDFTEIKPAANLSDDDLLAMRMALGAAASTSTMGANSSYFRVWNKLQKASDMIMEKEKADP